MRKAYKWCSIVVLPIDYRSIKHTDDVGVAVLGVTATGEGEIVPVGGGSVFLVFGHGLRAALCVRSGGKVSKRGGGAGRQLVPERSH